MKIDEFRESPHWSYSALNTYLNICQLQYYFRYIEHAEVEQTSACLPFGRAFHATLSQQAEVAKNGNYFNADELTDMFEQYFDAEIATIANIKYKSGESYDTMLEQARRMLHAAIDDWHDVFNIKSIAEAFKINVPFLDKPLIGEFDMVIEDGQDPCIVDWKTSATRWASSKAERDLQATVFSYAYLLKHGEIPSFRFDVVTKAKTPVCESHYTERGANEFKRFEYLATTAQEAIKKGVFLPSETSFACGDCPYKSRCASHHLGGN